MRETAAGHLVQIGTAFGNHRVTLPLGGLGQRGSPWFPIDDFKGGQTGHHIALDVSLRALAHRGMFVHIDRDPHAALRFGREIKAGNDADFDPPHFDRAVDLQPIHGLMA